MRIAIAIIGSLFILFGDVFADTMILRWMNDPQRVESIKVLDSNGSIYVDIGDLAQKLDLVSQMDQYRERIILDLPVNRLLFTSGNPFYYVDDQLKQTPYPLLSSESRLFLHIESLLSIMQKYYPGDLLFNPVKHELMVTPPRFDLYGVRYILKRDITEVVIPARKKLEQIVTIDSTDGSVSITFLNANVNGTTFPLARPKGHIEKIDGESIENGYRLIIYPDSGVQFRGLKFVDDPPLYVALFGGRSLSGTEFNNEDLDEDHQKWAMDVVVIDPGHGGKDPGAVGPTKLLEKTVVLDIGNRLRDALNKKGIKTIMTRESDKFVPLGARTKLANRIGGKLFISLHCNAAVDRRARGAETYILSQSKTERAMRVAEMENSVIRYEENQDDYQDLNDQGYILLTMAQAQFVQESQALAGSLQSSISAKIGQKNRGVDQAGFYVLVGASMPAILYEMGFISNYKEEKKLRDPKFRQKIADNLSEIIVTFLAEYSE